MNRFHPVLSSVILVALCAVIFCGLKAGHADGTGPVAVRQGSGGPSSYPPPPQRIVSANLGADQILLALAPERLIAVSYLSVNPQMSHEVEAARKVPHKVRTDPEQILALQPDLVVIGLHSSVRTFSLIEEAGVRIFRVRGYDSIKQIEETILDLGQALGMADRARRLISRMKSRLKSVSARVASLPRPKVLYRSLEGFTAGKDTILDSTISLAGGENLAAKAGISGWKKLSLETLLFMDPECLLVMSPTRLYLRTDRDFPLHPAVRRLRVFKKGKVQFLPARYLKVTSQHVAEAVEELARLFHPDAFDKGPKNSL